MVIKNNLEGQMKIRNKETGKEYEVAEGTKYPEQAYDLVDDKAAKKAEEKAAAEKAKAEAAAKKAEEKAAAEKAKAK